MVYDIIIRFKDNKNKQLIRARLSCLRYDYECVLSCIFSISLILYIDNKNSTTSVVLVDYYVRIKS